MPDQESDYLLAIARGLASRTPIDWAELESCAGDDSTRAAIRQLKIVAGIADLYHTIPVCPSPSADSDPQSPSTRQDRPGPRQSAASAEAWGGLVLVERIGQGSYGDVYRAWDRRLDREVALKLLRADGADLVGSTVIEEGRLLARVRHPNVVTVFGADRIDGRVGVWMEFVRGRTLERRLRENGVLSAEEVARIGSVLC